MKATVEVLDSLVSDVTHLSRLSSLKAFHLDICISHFFLRHSTSVYQALNVIAKPVNINFTSLKMFRRLSKSLPNDFEYDADLEKLGSFTVLRLNTHFAALLTINLDTTSTKMTRSAQPSTRTRNSTTSSQRMSVSAMSNVRQ